MNKGFTLLEVLLVLVIAAMIILVSVRYYQSASSTQNANTMIQQVQAIMSAIDAISGSTATGSVTQSSIKDFLGPDSLSSPYGSVTITGSSTGSGYAIAYPSNISSPVCTLVKNQLKSNVKITILPTTCSGQPMTFTYLP